MKLGTTVEQLCRPIPVEFRDYLNYCRSLEFEQEPDYDLLKGFFTNLHEASSFERDGKFDWDTMKWLENNFFLFNIHVRI